jgi:hypothetical protein
MADTWLHVTTKTVEFVQILPVASAPNYGFALNSNCARSNNSITAQTHDTPGITFSQCSLRVADAGCLFMNSTRLLQVLNNVSDVTTVLTYESNTPYTYLGIPEAQTTQRDYTATAIGMQTLCKPISSACNLHHIPGGSTPLYCTDAFEGDLGYSESWGTFYFY